MKEIINHTQLFVRSKSCSSFNNAPPFMSSSIPSLFAKLKFKGSFYLIPILSFITCPIFSITSLKKPEKTTLQHKKWDPFLRIHIYLEYNFYNHNLPHWALGSRFWPFHDPDPPLSSVQTSDPFLFKCRMVQILHTGIDFIYMYICKSREMAPSWLEQKV